MSYRVIVLPNARRNLEHYYQHAAKHAPLTAAKWLDRFQAEIETLAHLPERWPLAAESSDLQLPIRQMLFGRRQSGFRVLFTIEADEVRVLHIRRSTMDRASLDDVT